jgi:hypothetical protein
MRYRVYASNADGHKESFNESNKERALKRARDSGCLHIVLYDDNDLTSFTYQRDGRGLVLTETFC